MCEHINNILVLLNIQPSAAGDDFEQLKEILVETKAKMEDEGMIPIGSEMADVPVTTVRRAVPKLPGMSTSIFSKC